MTRKSFNIYSSSRAHQFELAKIFQNYPDKLSPQNIRNLIVRERRR